MWQKKHIYILLDIELTPKVIAHSQPYICFLFLNQPCDSIKKNKKYWTNYCNCSHTWQTILHGDVAVNQIALGFSIFRVHTAASVLERASRRLYRWESRVIFMWVLYPRCSNCKQRPRRRLHLQSRERAGSVGRWGGERVTPEKNRGEW